MNEITDAIPTAVLKIDLHCHSEASHDCITPVENIPLRCRDHGINIQAITDHDEIWGAQKIQEIVESRKNEFPNLSIIVGEEISSLEGEIIGLYLTERIPPQLSAEETVARIKAQGGLVLIPHAFDPLKRHRLRPVAREKIASHIDIIESFNARISFPKWNDAASFWAAERGVAQSAGSDAHTLKDVGTAWTETTVRKVTGPDDLLTALRESTLQGFWTHPVLAFFNKVVYYFKTHYHYLLKRLAVYFK